jgi:hypothetical protein
MTIINLDNIANQFSGMILFDGEGNTEIKIANKAYDFPSNKVLTDNLNTHDDTPVMFETLFNWDSDDYVDNGVHSQKFNTDLLKSQDAKDLLDAKAAFLNLSRDNKQLLREYVEVWRLNN